MASTRGDPSWRVGGLCRVCDEPIEPVTALPWPRFRHGDWSVMSTRPWTLFACPRCGLAGPESTDDFDHASYYGSRTYAERSVPVHHVRPPGSEAIIPGPQHQVELVRAYLPAAPSILDIGCFDGRLLRAFRHSYPAARLFGRDVGESLRRLFPPEDGIAFATDESLWAAGPFDLIVFSHSLQYVPDLNDVLQRAAAHLAPGGNLLVQVPNLESRPSSMLLGDLHQHFTRASLVNVLSLNGYDATVVEPTGFPRDLVMIAAPTSGRREVRSFDALRTVSATAGGIDAMAQKVTDLMQDGGGNVLGTTIDAAFVASVLGSKLQDFIDEAPLPVDACFLGRPVRHPATLAQHDRTFVPLGIGAAAVLRRLQGAYRGEFFLV
jgi:SAM-dependent methyltransferase